MTQVNPEHTEQYVSGLVKGAVISGCGRYRYQLTREWGTGRAVCFVMLNPSTADASIDDPTIRRCIGFAKRLGGSKLVVVNLFAYRSTDPSALSAQEDPEGEDNQHWIDTSVNGSSTVAAGWGVLKPPLPQSISRRIERLRSRAEKLWCLGKTKAGHPRHPLYVKADQPLVEWL